MIDREQVLHVARLARLELTDDEVAQMAGELSASSTTSRRSASWTSTASRRPRTWSRSPTRCAPTSRGRRLPREVALAQAPAVGDDGFRVPSPTA